MPNWCNNYLELTHDDPAMIERAKKAYCDGRLLDEFVPVPKDLHIVAGRVGDDDNPEQIALVEAEARNQEKYGYSTWYDYCVNEWGTKWDVGGDDGMITEDGPNALRMSFDSAWAPRVRPWRSSWIRALGSNSSIGSRACALLACSMKTVMTTMNSAI